jgi:hypothetical protein
VKDFDEKNITRDVYKRINFIFYQKYKKIISPFILSKLSADKDPDFNIFRGDFNVMTDFFGVRQSTLATIDCVVYDANKQRYTPVELNDFTESDLYLLKSLHKNDRLSMDKLDLQEISKSETKNSKNSKELSPKKKSKKKAKSKKEKYYDSLNDIYDTYSSHDDEFSDFDL